MMAQDDKTSVDLDPNGSSSDNSSSMPSSVSLSPIIAESHKVRRQVLAKLRGCPNITKQVPFTPSTGAIQLSQNAILFQMHTLHEALYRLTGMALLYDKGLCKNIIDAYRSLKETWTMHEKFLSTILEKLEGGGSNVVRRILDKTNATIPYIEDSFARMKMSVFNRDIPLPWQSRIYYPAVCAFLCFGSIVASLNAVTNALIPVALEASWGEEHEKRGRMLFRSLFWVCASINAKQCFYNLFRWVNADEFASIIYGNCTRRERIWVMFRIHRQHKKNLRKQQRRARRDRRSEGRDF